MSAPAPIVVPPPPHHSPLAPIAETCAWCGRTPLSCIACVECFELFCSQTCHYEFRADEEGRLRVKNAALEAFDPVN